MLTPEEKFIILDKAELESDALAIIFLYERDKLESTAEQIELYSKLINAVDNFRWEYFVKLEKVVKRR